MLASEKARDSLSRLQRITQALSGVTNGPPPGTMDHTSHARVSALRGCLSECQAQTGSCPLHGNVEEVECPFTGSHLEINPLR